MAMQFADWLAKTGTTHQHMAERMSVSRVFVTYLATGKRRPSLTRALEIEELTSGKVKPRDWPRANGHSK